MSGGKPRGKRPPDGETSRRRFGLTFVGSALIAAVLTYLVFNAVVYGQVSVSSVGGFQVNIGEASGEGLYIYPAAGDSSNCPDTRAGNDPDPKVGEEVLPQVFLEVDNAVVPKDEDLELTKDIDIPDVVPGTAGFRISLTRNTSAVTQDLSLGDVTVGLTEVTADEITLKGGGTTDLLIDDDFRGNSQGNSLSDYPNQAVAGDQIFGDPNRGSFLADPGGVLTVEGAIGGTVDIQNAEATGHFLSFGALDNLREFQLDIEYISDESNLNVGGDTCANPTIRGSTLLPLIESTNNPDPGNQLSVDVTVQNPGADSINGYVNLYLQGRQLDSQSVSFSSGPSTKSVTLTGTANGPEDFYTATVNTTEFSGGNGEQFGETTEEVAVGAPPNVDVTITGNTSPSIEGNPIDVTADLTNNGDITADQQVNLNILSGGTSYESGVDSVDINLAGGGSTTETFTWNTEVGDAGNFQAEVSTNKNSDTTGVTVQSNQPTFDVAIDNTNEPVAEGEILEVTATVDNVGAVSGTQFVTLTARNTTALFREEVDNKSITLSGGSSTTQTFQWQTQAGDKDNSTYTAIVASDDDSESVANQKVGNGDDYAVSNVQQSSVSSVSGSESGNLVEGDTVTVSFDVTNNGDLGRDQTATLDIDNGVGQVDTTTVNVAPGNTQTFSMSWNTNVGDGGNGQTGTDYTATVTVPDDIGGPGTGTTNLNVEERVGDLAVVQGGSDVRFGQNTANNNIQVGTPNSNGGGTPINVVNNAVKADVQIENNGNFEADGEARLRSFDTSGVLASANNSDFPLGPGETTTVTPADGLQYTPQKDSNGGGITTSDINDEDGNTDDDDVTIVAYNLDDNNDNRVFGFESYDAVKPFFDVSSMSVENGESTDIIDATYDVENLGNVQDTQEITFDADGSQRDSTTFSLSSGGTVTADTLDWNNPSENSLSSGDPRLRGNYNDYSGTVSSERDSASDTFQVIDGAIVVANINVPNLDDGGGGTSGTVNYDAGNPGFGSASATVTEDTSLRGSSTSNFISLNAGGTSSESFGTGTCGSGDYGDYSASVTGADGGGSGNAGSSVSGSDSCDDETGTGPFPVISLFIVWLIRSIKKLRGGDEKEKADA